MSHAIAARLMRTAIYMLVSAADDVEAGRYTADERAHLADGLDQLSAALRTESPVIDGEVRS